MTERKTEDVCTWGRNKKEEEKENFSNSCQRQQELFFGKKEDLEKGKWKNFVPFLL